ncbi:MAG: hypothetical protein ACREMO_13545 [Gemmatimonadales bacterium]
MINRTRIGADTLKLLEQQYGTAIPDGKYWYDPMCGAWGLEGGPTQGFTVAGLPLGGPLPVDISGGGTQVFINGRELHPTDLAGLQRLLGPVIPGRYWVDAQGYAGSEGGPPIVNLWQAASQQGQYRQGNAVGENYGGGAGAYGNLNTGIGIITDGEGGAAVFSH